MKILHTSDWHLGHKFNGFDRSEEFKLTLDWMRSFIEQEKIDILIISGDIFDVYYPSQEVLKDYYNFLSSLKNLLKKIIIIAGNHDSIHTLSAPKEILKYLDIEIISGNEDEINNMDNFIININKELSIIAVPFLREAILNKKFSNKNLQEAIYDFYQTLFKKTKKRIITTGHFTVTGGKLTGDEKEIYIGNIETTSKDVFKGAEYVALGHLHKYQEIDKNIVYSGSLLSMNFNDNEIKKVVVYDTDEKEYKAFNIPKYRDILKFKGKKEEIENDIKNYHPKKLEGFLEIEINENITKNEIETLKNLAKNNGLNLISVKVPVKENIKKRTNKNVSLLEIFENEFKDEKNFDELKKVFENLLKEIQNEN
jgi:exonuclease SbcD